MTTAPHGMGETAMVMKLCRLLNEHPELHFHKIEVYETGHIDIAVNGGTGVVHDWCRALPERRETTGLAATAYGSTEAVVLTQDVLRVTIRPSFVGGSR